MKVKIPMILRIASSDRHPIRVAGSLIAIGITAPIMVMIWKVLGWPSWLGLLFFILVMIAGLVGEALGRAIEERLLK